MGISSSHIKETTQVLDLVSRRITSSNLKLLMILQLGLGDKESLVWEGGNNQNHDFGFSPGFMLQEFLRRKKRILGEGRMLHIGRSRLLDKERKKKGLKSEVGVARRRLCFTFLLNSNKQYIKDSKMYKIVDSGDSPPKPQI